MATEERIWDLVGFGNVELSERNFLFRIQTHSAEDNNPMLFMATFVPKDVSKTLTNIGKAAKMAALPKPLIPDFMRAVSIVLPIIFKDVSSSANDMALEEQRSESQPAMIEEASRLAEKILDSSEPLDRVDPYLSSIICGEDKNRKILFLKACGTKSTDKRVKWIVIITGESGAGKSAMMSIITKTCKCKVVGRMTAHALDYLELQGYDVLVLKEVGYMDKDDTGLSTIKFVSVDDGGYTVEVPMRDPETGEMTTRQYRIPPINVLTSSTRVQFDPQFERRAEFVNPDESEQQTKRVYEFKAEAERQNAAVKLGKRHWTDEEFATEVIRQVLTGIEDSEVEIPFPTVLNKVLKKTPIRTRGDIGKLYANVRLYTLLTQRTQKVITTPSGGSVIFASPYGGAKVIELFRESFETMIGGLDKRTRTVIQKMAELGWKSKQRISMDERIKLADQMKKSPQTIYQFLERLYTNTLVKKWKDGDGKTAAVSYELIFDPSEMLSSPLVAPAEVEALQREMTAEGFKFLRSLCLPDRTLSEIMIGWGKPFEERRKRLKLENIEKQTSITSLNAFRRTIRSISPEITAKASKNSLLRSMPQEGYRLESIDNGGTPTPGSRSIQERFQT